MTAECVTAAICFCVCVCHRWCLRWPSAAPEADTWLWTTSLSPLSSATQTQVTLVQPLAPLARTRAHEPSANPERAAPPEATVDPSVADCDFDGGLCGYHQERLESRVWSRVSVSPSAYRMGDHTTGTGAAPADSRRLPQAPPL